MSEPYRRRKLKPQASGDVVQVRRLIEFPRNVFWAGHACFARANGLGHPCFAHRVVNQHAQNEGDEDQEAGFAGAPFVQPAHDEEWMEYIDWGEVEAQAGGSSSSGA